LNGVAANAMMTTETLVNTTSTMMKHHSESSHEAFWDWRNDNIPIRVVARLRPLSLREQELGLEEDIAVADDSTSSSNSILEEISIPSLKKNFTIDAVLNQFDSQKCIYDTAIGNAVLGNIFRGLSTTVIAFGQCGSGKTFTMDTEVKNSFDNQEDTCIMVKSDGIIVRAVHDLFLARDRFHHENRKGDSVVHMTLFEVCNNVIFDLLENKNNRCNNRTQKKSSAFSPAPNASCTSTVNNSPKLQVCGNNVKGLSSLEVNTPKQVLTKMCSAMSRKKRQRKCSDSSLRSHTICVLHVTFASADSRAIKYSKLTLVDMAGANDSCERVQSKQNSSDNSNASRVNMWDKKYHDGLVEQQQFRANSASINKDLLAFGRVISTLAIIPTAANQKANSSSASWDFGSQQQQAPKRIPYRDSILTQLLRVSLDGSDPTFQTVLIACLSPTKVNARGSSKTLHVAQQACSIRRHDSTGLTKTKFYDEMIPSAKIVRKSSRARTKQCLSPNKHNHEQQHFPTPLSPLSAKHDILRFEWESIQTPKRNNSDPLNSRHDESPSSASFSSSQYSTDTFKTVPQILCHQQLQQYQNLVTNHRQLHRTRKQTRSHRILNKQSATDNMRLKLRLAVMEEELRNLEGGKGDQLFSVKSIIIKDNNNCYNDICHHSTQVTNDSFQDEYNTYLPQQQQQKERHQLPDPLDWIDEVLPSRVQQCNHAPFSPIKNVIPDLNEDEIMNKDAASIGVDMIYIATSHDVNAIISSAPSEIELNNEEEKYVCSRRVNYSSSVKDVDKNDDVDLTAYSNDKSSSFIDRKGHSKPQTMAPLSKKNELNLINNFCDDSSKGDKNAKPEYFGSKQQLSKYQRRKKTSYFSFMKTETRAGQKNTIDDKSNNGVMMVTQQERDQEEDYDTKKGRKNKFAWKNLQGK